MGDSGVTPASASALGVWDALKVFQGYIQVLTDLKANSETLQSTKDELQKQLDTEKGTNEQLNKTNTELKAANDKLDEDKKKLQNDYDELFNVKKALQEKCDKLEIDNQVLQDRLNRHTCHEGDTEELKKLNDHLEALKDAMQKENDSLKKDKDELRQTVDKLNNDLTNTKAAKDTLREERDKFQKDYDDVKKQRDDFQTRLQRYGDEPIPVDIIYKSFGGAGATEPVLSNVKEMTLGKLFNRTSGPFEVYSLSREAKVMNVRFKISPDNGDAAFDLTTEEPFKQIGSKGKNVDVFGWGVEGVMNRTDTAGVVKSDQSQTEAASA